MLLYIVTGVFQTLKILRKKITMDYVSKLNIITKVFIKGGRRIKIKGDITMKQRSERAGGFEDAKLVVLMSKKEMKSPGMQVPSNNWKK